MKVSLIILLCSVVLDQISGNDIFENSLNRNLIHSNILYGLGAESINLFSDKTKCSNDFAKFLYGIDNNSTWALKLFDSANIIPSSFIWGNNYWLSSVHFCDSLDSGTLSFSYSENAGKYMMSNLLNSTPPFPVRYRVIYSLASSPMQINVGAKVILHIGLCLPSSCSRNEIFSISGRYFKNNTLDFQRLNNIDIQVNGSKELKFLWNIFFKDPAVIVFCVIAIILIILSISSAIVSNNLERNYNLEKIERTIFQRTALCFSFSKNLSTLFHEPDSSHFLSVIAGLRTISCIWIVTFHTVYHTLFMQNNYEISVKMEEFLYQPIYHAPYYVDVFFVLSGFLLAFNFLKNSSRMSTLRKNDVWDNLLLFVKYIFHRYIRLTPLFVITMLLTYITYIYYDMSSPFVVDESNDLYCGHTWWYNLLYIHNFQSLRNTCSPWGWYLACDMQFYIIFLGIIFIYAKHKIFAKGIYLSLAILSLGVSFFCYYMAAFDFRFDTFVRTEEMLYVKPWTRMNSYIAAVLIAWLLCKSQKRPVKLARPLVFGFWIISGIILLFTSFITYKRDFNRIICATIMTFGKFIFGLMVAGVICVCQMGHGVLFTRFMSCKLFVHLNKLTYSMYLLSYLVIHWMYGLRETPDYYQDISGFMDTVSCLVFSYVLSLLSYSLFEAPFQNLSDEFIFHRNKVSK